MQVNSIKGFSKTLGSIFAAGALVASAPALNVQQKHEIQRDTIELSVDRIPPKGTDSLIVLTQAPDASLYVQGKKRFATIIVDLSENVLYKYDEGGNAEMAYRVASGKPQTPTDTGLRIVSHTERYPYKSAPPTTKRYKAPWDYGPRAIIVETLDPQTGEKGKTGEFIHGNNDASSIGTYASKGCIRMDNEVIKKLASQVKRGDLVLIKD